MKPSFTLVWSFRNRIDVLLNSIITAHKTCPTNVNFCLVDAASDESTINKLRIRCNSITELFGRKIRICESAYRSSLSEAWNLGIMLSDSSHVIFASSDVEFLTEDWFFNIANAAHQNFEYYLIENHAVFLLSKAAIPKMGWFDEKYKIGPHMDTDAMIRTSENNIKFGIALNNGSYKHGDISLEERQKGEIKDRLPMDDLYNENYFKSKWKSDWEGWHNQAHPPTHISQVTRMFPEQDPHPLYTKKFAELYK